MSTKLSVICSYNNKYNKERKHYIYYDENKKLLRDFKQDGGYIRKLEIKDNHNIVIHYETEKDQEISKTISNVKSFNIVNDEIKNLLLKKSIITYSTQDTFNIEKMLLINTKILEQQLMNKEIEYIHKTILDISKNDKVLQEKFSFIEDISPNLHETLKFLINYNRYINREKEETTEEKVMAYLCSGIIFLNNPDYNMFCIKPNLINIIITKLKRKQLEEIIQISTELFNNKDINELNKLKEQELNNILTELIHENNISNKKRIKSY